MRRLTGTQQGFGLCGKINECEAKRGLKGTTGQKRESVYAAITSGKLMETEEEDF